MRPRDLLLLLAGWLLVPSLARAENDVVIDATAQAFFAGRPDARDGETKTIVPLIGMISLRATGVPNPLFNDLRIVLSGWGQVDPAEPAHDDHATGDLDLAYIEAEAGRGRLRVRLGRQLLFGGAARATQFDGGFADVRIAGGLGLSGEVGLPVQQRFEADRRDILWGGRLYYRHSVDAEIGASYFHEFIEGRLARFDFGLDGRFQITRRVLVGANAVFAASEERLAEAKVYAAFEAARRLRIAVDATRTAPDLFLPRNSILSVFSSETRDEAGATVTWRSLRSVRLEADGRVLHVEEGTGGRASLRGEYHRDAHVLGAEVRGLLLPDDGYFQGRLFGRVATSARSRATLDLSVYALDEPFNGERFSGSAIASWGIDFDGGWRAMVSGLAGTDPLYERRFEGLLRVAKDFTWHERRPR